MKNLSLKLSDDLDLKLRSAARRKGTSRSALVREAIVTFLSRDEAPVPGSFLELAGDLIGQCEGPEDLSFNPEYMKNYGR